MTSHVHSIYYNALHPFFLRELVTIRD